MVNNQLGIETPAHKKHGCALELIKFLFSAGAACFVNCVYTDTKNCRNSRMLVSDNGSSYESKEADSTCRTYGKWLAHVYTVSEVVTY